MKKIKFLILNFLFLILSATLSVAQTPDSLNVLDIDPTGNSTYNLSSNNENFEQIFEYETQIRTQKLYKNIFLISFLFMIVFSGFLFFIYQSKTKQVLNLIKLQENELELKNFEVKKLGMILNNTEDAVAISDQNGKIIWTNQSFFNIFETTNEELEQSDFFNIFVSEKAEIKELLEKCKQKNTSIMFQDELKNKKNEIVWYQRKIIPVLAKNDKQPANYVVIDTDFTALKLAMDRKN